MIKRVIKLDGTKEDFMPSKLNHWGEWAAAPLGEYVDWTTIVLSALADLPEEVTSQQLQQELISKCLDKKSWSYYLMAGKLYVPLMRKAIFGTSTPPTIMQVQSRLIADGLMVYLNYSAEEFAHLETIINHDLDFEAPQYSLYHMRYKYSLRNQITGKEYELPQFVYMRMAMALGESEPKEERMMHVEKYYKHLSEARLSAPTPNYVNLGTPLRGYASCCLFISDDTGPSLATGDYIANMMTQKSAGIGSNLLIRSLGDPVKGGVIKHQGKNPYYAAQGKSTRANLQNGRGGAETTYYMAYDPDAEDIAQLSNPRSVEEKRNRDLHYALMSNAWFAYKLSQNEDVFTFNVFTAPDLTAAFYSGDIDRFIELYEEYEANPNFKKKYISPRRLLMIGASEAFETGVAYLANMDEINRHTPFKEPIHSSNLCAEITQPTISYPDASYLYRTDDHGQGEISTCNLAATIPQNIRSDEEYAEVCYYALKMIDKTTEMAEYAFPHLAFTALQRRNAGVGIMGMANMMAIAGVKISNGTGKRFAHKTAETHMWHLIGASLKIAKERGVAPWIHKTKWPEGWMPIDTYNRSVDEIGNFPLLRDWEARRAEVIAMGGIAHSALCAYMPGESSSKAIPTGVVNSIYPTRNTELTKGDGNLRISWAAFESDRPGMDYEIAWDVPMRDMIDFYAIFQKFTDQSISADLYRSLGAAEVVTEDEIVEDYLYLVEKGMKTRYYFNTRTATGKALDHVERAFVPQPLTEAQQQSLDEYSRQSAGLVHDGQGFNDSSATGEVFAENNDATRGCAGGSCSL